jgi:hypothetical protein
MSGAPGSLAGMRVRVVRESMLIRPGDKTVGASLWKRDRDPEQTSPDFRQDLARLVPVFMPDLLFRLHSTGVTTVYDPVFALSPDGTRYVSVASDTPTTLPLPGLPFSFVFRAEPGREDVALEIAAAYEAASRRRIAPPAFGPLQAEAV